jgi:hypothetical protein
MVLPLTVATLRSELVKLTGSPELAVATSENGGLVVSFAAIALNVIVCAALSTVKIPAPLVTGDPTPLLRTTEYLPPESVICALDI